MAGVVSFCQMLLQTPVVGYNSQEPPALNAWRNLARLVPSVSTDTPLPTAATLVRPTPTRPPNNALALDKRDRGIVNQRLT